jgi:hypothetical protein
MIETTDANRGTNVRVDILIVRSDAETEKTWGMPSKGPKQNV